jgi:nitrate/nitrite-specific signal transduction histidine kinase
MTEVKQTYYQLNKEKMLERSKERQRKMKEEGIKPFKSDKQLTNRKIRNKEYYQDHKDDLIERAKSRSKETYVKRVKKPKIVKKKVADYINEIEELVKILRLKTARKPRVKKVDKIIEI